MVQSDFYTPLSETKKLFKRKIPMLIVHRDFHINKEQISANILFQSANTNPIFHPLTTFLNKIKKTANKILKMSDKQGIEIHNESDISKLSFKDETMKGDAYYAYRCL